jgi:plasmid stabilization system protein ParE
VQGRSHRNRQSLVLKRWASRAIDGFPILSLQVTKTELQNRTGRSRFTEAARAELIDAQDWYEAEGSDLGHRFHAAIDSVVRRMTDNPRQFPTVFNTLRRAHAKKFPHALFFLVEPDARQTGRSMLFVVTNKFPPVPNNPSRFPFRISGSKFSIFLQSTRHRPRLCLPPYPCFASTRQAGKAAGAILSPSCQH